MSLSLRTVIRRIPVIKRVYTSISVRIFKLINKKNFLMSFMDSKFFLNIQEPIDKSLILFNYYENEQLNTSIEFIQNYKVNIFIDIGAHCGIYSLIIANKFNKIKIYSFEPIKKSYSRLLKNILLNNNPKNLKIFNYGLSSKNTKLRMKALIKKNYIQLGGFGVTNDNENIENNYITTAYFKKGDDILKFKNEIIFLKIDVEGHELLVLEGLVNLFKNNKILIQIEIFPNNYIFVKQKMIELNLEEVKKINNDFYFIKKK